MELVPNQSNAINLFITTDKQRNNQYKNTEMICLKKFDLNRLCPDWVRTA